MPKFVEVRTEDWLKTCQDARRYREQFDPLTALNDAAGTDEQLRARLRIAMNFIEEWSNWWSYALAKDDNVSVSAEERDAASKMAESLGRRASDMVIDNRQFLAANVASKDTALLEMCHGTLSELVKRIERCGASPALTHAVTLCSDLMMAIGNPSDEYAIQRVLAERHNR